MNEMEINKEFFEDYQIKRLMKSEHQGVLVFYMRMKVSPFYKDKKYHVVAEDSAVEQLSIEFDLPKNMVRRYLGEIAESALIERFEDKRTATIFFN